jgi:hypothetical protein
MMNIDKEIMDRPRRPPVDIDAVGTKSPSGDSWIDDEEAEADEAETDDAFVLGESGDSSSDLNEL